ncbi:hypothetical protein Taro_040001 [Colocasia esculenta]|uniref:Uncharacterized protein n=1 Tax=Colocasia esculenta TaxID=4460 RepID=A0A843WT56_COLES|nr:hypothetical protein [Colocasia esculenta]
MVEGSLGLEEEGPDEEAPAKEDPGRTSTVEEGKEVVEEVKGVGEEIFRERGLLGTGGAGGAVDEEGGEGGAGVGRVEGSGTTTCASPTAAEISRDDKPSAYRWILSLSKRLALIPLVAQLTSPEGG